MELRHLRYFIAVAEELHFGRAAKRVHIAEPPLSQQIRRLEEELKVKLLERTTRRVQLTDAGRAFLREARLTIFQAERAIQVGSRVSRGELGELSLGFVPAADMKLLPRILPTYRRRFPEVHLELHSLNGPAQVQALRERRIQAGFLFKPLDEDDLVVESILKEPFVVVLPKSHKLSKLSQIPLKTLAQEPFIFFRRDVAPGFYDVIANCFLQAGYTFKIAQEADHIQTNLGLVAMGLGVSLLPASIQVIRREGVVYRPLRAPIPHVEMALAHRRDDSSEVLQAFLMVVKKIAAEKPF